METLNPMQQRKHDRAKKKFRTHRPQVVKFLFIFHRLKWQRRERPLSDEEMRVIWGNNE